MNIYTPRFSRVKFISCDQDQIRWGNNDDPNGLLKPNETYVVDRTEVHSSHTKVFLMKFPNKKFNSVCFENVSRGRLERDLIVNKAKELNLRWAQTYSKNCKKYYKVKLWSSHNLSADKLSQLTLFARELNCTDVFEIVYDQGRSYERRSIVFKFYHKKD